MGGIFPRPETATIILESGLFDLRRFYEGCSVMPKTATNILENDLFDLRRFYEGVFRNAENRDKYPRKRPFRPSEILRGGCSVMPKTATNILENGLFDLRRFYEGVFRNAENRDKYPRKRPFRFPRFFHEVEFVWVLFTANEVLFQRSRNSDFARSKQIRSNL